MQARAQQGSLGTDHGQGGAMDMVLRPPIVVIQVSRVYLYNHPHYYRIFIGAYL